MDDKEQTGTPSIEIDSNSGFCFGVVTAIQKAEAELARTGQLRCLGDIVHNASEVDRLGRLGLITINHADLEDLRRDYDGLWEAAQKILSSLAKL